MVGRGTAVVSPLRDRLVQAVVEALAEGDPFVTIAVGDNRVEVSWGKEP